MHPLVRDLAVALLSNQSDGERASAADNFVFYVLGLASTELASLGQTAASAPVAAQLLGWEAQNFAAMLQLVVATDRDAEAAMLNADSPQGEWCRAAMDALANALSSWGQLQLAERAGHAAWNARSQ